MRPTWVIVCGLLRNKELALDKFNALHKWLQEGKIQGVVCCWWRRETDDNPDVVQHVLGLGFKIVQIEEPRLRTIGHSIHQSMTWWYALQAVPEGAFVLKTRPDLGALEDDLIERLNAMNLEIVLPHKWPRIFNHKVVVRNAYATSPYYIHDINFYGQREDLLKLANFDLSSEYICANLATEQFFYRGPFAPHFPLLDAYLQAYSPLQFDNPDGSARRIDAQLASDFFLEVFVTYMKLLDVYFRVGFVADAERETDLDKWRGVDLADALNGKVEDSGLNFARVPCAQLFESEAPIKAVLNNLMGDEALRARMARALMVTSDYEYIAKFTANPLAPDPRAVELCETIGTIVDHVDHKYERRHDPEKAFFVILGHHDRVSSALETDAVKTLEAEVSKLRRIIDELRGRIA